MPFAQHIRITASGTFGETSTMERWSWRLNMSDPLASEDPVDDQDQMDDIVADITAFHSRPASMIGLHSRLREIKVARIGPDGKYLEDPRIAAVNVNGGQNNPIVYPPQVALAVSLGSDRRGASGRGRFYLPGPVCSFSIVTGLVSVAEVEGVRGSVVTLIEALNNQPGVEGAAPKVTIASSKGFNSDVTEVRVGRALDTIRSRRTSLLESYTAPVAVG